MTITLGVGLSHMNLGVWETQFIPYKDAPCSIQLYLQINWQRCGDFWLLPWFVLKSRDYHKLQKHLIVCTSYLCLGLSVRNHLLPLISQRNDEYQLATIVFRPTTIMSEKEKSNLWHPELIWHSQLDLNIIYKLIWHQDTLFFSWTQTI